MRRNITLLAIAILFMRFLCIIMFMFPWRGLMTSEVINKSIEIKAMNIIKSFKDKSRFILHFSSFPRGLAQDVFS